jgi:hypothetical protein
VGGKGISQGGVRVGSGRKIRRGRKCRKWDKTEISQGGESVGSGRKGNKSWCSMCRKW